MHTQPNYLPNVRDGFAAALPGLRPDRLGLPFAQPLWSEICESPRMRRIMTDLLVDDFELSRVRLEVLTLLQGGDDYMDSVTVHAGAALCAPRIRRIVRRSEIEPLISEIGPEAYGFAMSEGKRRAVLKQPVTADLIRSTGRGAYRSWKATLSQGEARLLDKSFAVADGTRLPDASAAAGIFERALEAVDAHAVAA